MRLPALENRGGRYTLQGTQSVRSDPFVQGVITNDAINKCRQMCLDDPECLTWTVAGQCLDNTHQETPSCTGDYGSCYLTKPIPGKVVGAPVWETDDSPTSYRRVSGLVVNTTRMKWTFWIILGIIAVVLLCIFLFMNGRN